MQLARCSKCKRSLPVKEFNSSSYTKLGIRTRCRSCESSDKKDYKRRKKLGLVKAVKKLSQNLDKVKADLNNNIFMAERLKLIKKSCNKIEDLAHAGLDVEKIAKEIEETEEVQIPDEDFIKAELGFSIPKSTEEDKEFMDFLDRISDDDI